MRPHRKRDGFFMDVLKCATTSLSCFTLAVFIQKMLSNLDLAALPRIGSTGYIVRREKGLEKPYCVVFLFLPEEKQEPNTPDV